MSPLFSRRPRQRQPAQAEVTGVPEAPPGVVFQAAAIVLSYPDGALMGRLGLVRAAVSGTTAEPLFVPVLDHLGNPAPSGQPPQPGDASTALALAQSFHIQEFDLSRRHALHLSYWTDGDTRRRGEVLAEIKAVYRASGLVVDTGGELPDYLPMVLEFAVADPARGVDLLQRFRASLELLRLGLTKDHLPHAGVLEAVCGCLPGESPSSPVEVQALYAQAQPVEFVGLDQVTMPTAAGRPSAAATQPVRI